MPLPYKRAVRVGELIQQTISEIVREIRDLDCGLVTIMGVKLSDDLLSCRIFYSVFGSQDDKQKADAILKKSVGLVRHELALRLNLRRTPSIIFVYDDTTESASRVLNILEKIKDEKN
ncbi:MAG: 30S ribosome-binding factor RbfA [Endomicrobium sp.]|jgi:ribosome-binding factor A|nr:30S ribosome-binding factor RbfA [Endomicrobium sp.]